MNCCNRTDWEGSGSQSVSISFPAVPGCCPRKHQPTSQWVKVLGKISIWFLLQNIPHCHSPLGENRKSTQAGCSGGGTAPQEQEFPQSCSQVKISHSLTRLAVICSIFTLSFSIPWHLQKLRYQHLVSFNFCQCLMRINSQKCLMSHSQDKEGSFRSLSCCRKLPACWGIHPYASYLLLRFSGFFYWTPKGKRRFCNTTLQTSVLEKANFVQGHNFYKLASVLTLACSKTAMFLLVLSIDIKNTSGTGIKTKDRQL